MTWREWTSTTWMRGALGALALGVATLAWTLAGALRADVVPAAPAEVTITEGALATPASPAAVDVTAVVATDLFSTTRTAPAVRYRPPGEVVATGPSAPQEPLKPVVLGTAIGADGTSFATCQFDSPRLLMIRVGDHVGNYTVKSIERGSVVFTTPAGKVLEILAPRPGS